jgi:hypothetical protein
MNVIRTSQYPENVESLNYLVSVIANNGRFSREMKSKIDMANQHSKSSSLPVMKPT